MQGICCLVRCLVGFLFLLVLTGCAGRAPLSSESERRSWQQHMAGVSTLTQWQISGKLGVRNESDAGSATLEWEERDGHYVIYLTGPFGQSLASIQGVPGFVSMTVPNQAVITASSLENLLYREMGWVIPFSLLQCWVKGVPAPGEYDDLQLNTYNRLMSLSQAGWQITFDRYDVTSDYDLPGRLKLQKADAKVTILVRSWKLFF